MIQIQLQRFDPHAMLEPTDSASRAPAFEPFGEDGLTFSDIVDALNPLHHIPFVGSIYRKITGDEIDPAMRVAGGALFGGPIGILVSAATLAIDRLSNGFENAEPVPESVGQTTRDLQTPDENIVLTSPSNRQTAINRLNELEVAAQSKLPASDSVVRIRPGGWMVIHAYGPNDPGSINTLRNTHGVSIDVSV
ncbi:MAG: hypothetical protein O3C28_10860 [Proteobacteria bacterium]|nr:hypothetical protein [Pseudomonadota bacterium]